MPKNTELGFQSPRRTALRICLLKTHPGSPITSRGQPKLPPLVSSPWYNLALAWEDQLVSGCPRLSPFENRKSHSPARSQRPGRLGRVVTVCCLLFTLPPPHAPTCSVLASCIWPAFRFWNTLSMLIPTGALHLPLPLSLQTHSCLVSDPGLPGLSSGLFHDHATRPSSDGKSPWCFATSTPVTYVLKKGNH